MSHTGIDVFDFILFTIYPVVGLFVVEFVSKIIKISKWIKTSTQGFVSLMFAIVYLTFLGNDTLPLTAIVLFALSWVLFYQTKKTKQS